MSDERTIGQGFFELSLSTLCLLVIYFLLLLSLDATSAGTVLELCASPNLMACG